MPRMSTSNYAHMTGGCVDPRLFGCFERFRGPFPINSHVSRGVVFVNVQMSNEIPMFHLSQRQGR